MTIATALIEETKLIGINITIEHGDIVLSRRPPADLRELLVRHKPEILRELRRRQAVAMLSADTDLQRAYIVDADSDPDHVLVMLAMRGTATGEMQIPRPQWDAMLFLKFLESRLQ